MFLLVSVPRPFNEQQFIFGGGRHVSVDVLQKACGVAVSEGVVSADNQRARVSDLLDL